VGWLAGWLVGWLAGWLVGWLAITPPLFKFCSKFAKFIEILKIICINICKIFCIFRFFNSKIFQKI
ncbi:hypothetical protein, partial [Campylobacter concisus]|uniref:hypothetical protein n=1 Tax=Campylobacter concisus TaxID=199 RepID=UPI001CB85922